MKKTGISLIAAGAFTLLLSACGSKYTPMTDEQIQAKADSTFNATKTEIMNTKQQACDAGMAAQVDAKVQQLKAAAQAPK
jgi:hypothetical protein